MSAMGSHNTDVSIVYSTVCSGADQRKHQSSAPLAFVRGIHRWPVNSPNKGPVTRIFFFIWWRHHEMHIKIKFRKCRPFSTARNIINIKWQKGSGTNLKYCKDLLICTKWHHMVPWLMGGTKVIIVKVILLDSKVQGANMGPIWGWQDPGGPNVVPMNFAIWELNISESPIEIQWSSRKYPG